MKLKIKRLQKDIVVMPKYMTSGSVAFDICSIEDVDLAPGSLITMEGKCQKYWKHAIPKRTRIHEPRINLTFRTIIND